MTFYVTFPFNDIFKKMGTGFQGNGMVFPLKEPNSASKDFTIRSISGTWWSLFNPKKTDEAKKSANQLESFKLEPKKKSL